MITTSKEAPTHGTGTTPGGRVRLQWPPPGLEPAHDTLWPLASAYTRGALVLALPLLLAIGVGSPFYSLGTFGQSWWVPVVTTLLGFGMLLVASMRLRIVLRDTARGAELGHGWWIVLATAADRTRDNGFVLQGARSYAALTAADRRRLVTVRGVAPLLYLCAALWIPLGLTLGALLGYMQILGASSLWLITLVPAVACWLAAIVAHALVGTLARPARVAEQRAAARDELRYEAVAWTTNLELLAGDDVPAGRRVSPRSLRVASWAVILPALLLSVVVMAVTASAALGPMMAAIAVPATITTQARYAQLEVLRPYRLPTDPAVTPVDAGRALHALIMMNQPAHEPLFQPPVRTYDAPWWPGPAAGGPLGSPALWSMSLFERLDDGLAADERAFLADIAAHPAHREYEVLAAAAGADFAGARYVSPLPDDETMQTLPIVRFGHTRSSAYAHIAAAANELAQGDAAAAERMVREVISAGLLIADESNMLIDALVGTAIARTGGEALVSLYRATGRSAEADRIDAAVAASQQAADRMQSATARPSLAAALDMMPRVVLDDAALRALRWEYLSTFSTVSPCINLNQAVLGRDQHYQDWIADAEASLVRHEGERQLFELARNGIMGTRDRPFYRCGVNLDRLRLLR